MAYQKSLDQVRDAIRLKQYALRTAKAYFVKRFILGYQHPPIP